MANGQGPRRGLGIAFQGRAETPDYLLTQAQNQAQRRRQTQADLQEQQQEAQQSAMDDLGDMGDKIHPAYNPIKQRLKDEYFQRVKQVKNQTKPGRKFTNTEGYFKAKNDLQRAFKKLERSSENFRNYRDQVMKDDNVIGDPKVLDAFAKQDLNQVKQFTGNELGLFGDVPMRKYSPTDLNKNIADRLGVNETLESLEGAGGFQQMKQVINESPEAAKFEQGLRAEYRGDPSLQKTAKELYGAGNEDEFVEYQMRMIPSERKVSTKRMPDQDGRGSGGRGGDPSIYGTAWNEWGNVTQETESSTEAIKNWADRTRMKPTNVSGIDLAYDVSDAAQGNNMTFQSDELYSKGDINAMTADRRHVKLGETPFQPATDKKLTAPVRVQDSKVMFGYYDDNNNLSIVEDEGEAEGRNVMPVVRYEVKPIDYEKDGAKPFDEGYKEVKNNERLYKFFPLGYRSEASRLDAINKDANRYMEQEESGRGIIRTEQSQPANNEQGEGGGDGNMNPDEILGKYGL